MIFEKIEKILNNAAKKEGFNENFSISFSNLPKVCDFQCNDSFSFAKKYNLSPLEFAQKVVSNIGFNKDFIFEVAKPAFINIKMTDSFLSEIGRKFLTNGKDGILKHKSNGIVFMDYGGANVAKTLHIGHLRPAIVGESLKRLYKFLGETVVCDVHLGDWGLQMGLNELQLYEDGVLDYYFGKSNKKKKITLEMLNIAYPKASSRKNSDEEFKKKAEDWTLKIQNKEEPFYQIYQEIKSVSVKKIKSNYKKLGAEFDLWCGESDCANYIKPSIDLIVKKGLTRVSDNALVVDVANENENIPIINENENEVQRFKNPMPPVIIKKYNGSALYATTDIATIYMRNKLYPNISRIEYITDQRQKLHFTQVFRVCKMSGISPESQKLTHICNGTINGKDGKPFKTRSGDTIKLEDIIELLMNKAGEKLLSNGVEFSKSLALKIGVGAMKFGDLLNNVDKDYILDLDKFMAFEGKTGPYLQYTAVRINSILKKTGKVNPRYFSIYNVEMAEVVKNIIKLNSSYELCYANKTLAPLCLATYNLCSAFSNFYNNYSVINESDMNVKNSYIAMLMLVKNKINQALKILAIDVPSKM